MDHAIEAIRPGRRREIVEQLDWTAYKNLAAMNPSTLVFGLKSMRHLRHAWYNPRKDTDAMRWGRAVHTLLFEPQEFLKRFTSWSGRRAGNEYADFYAEATTQGYEVLTEQQFEDAEEAARNFVGDPLVQSLIKRGKPEVTLFTVEFCLQCRGRVDWLDTKAPIILDLKTAKDISARGFARDFYKYHYDVKLGLYRRWASQLLGGNIPVKVIAVENKPPFDVAVVPVPDAVLDRGAAKGVDVLKALRDSLDENRWPGIAGEEEYFLDTPSWEMDEELEGAEDAEEEYADAV
jgi:hypothetical protein